MSFQIFRYFLSSFQIKTQPATRTHKCLLTVSSSLRHKSKDPILSTRVCSHRWREASPINPRCRRERANFLFPPFSSAPILRSSVTKSSTIVLETASSLSSNGRAARILRDENLWHHLRAYRDNAWQFEFTCNYLWPDDHVTPGKAIKPGFVPGNLCFCRQKRAYSSNGIRGHCLVDRN
mgnify:CR=1 FL=1